MKLHEQDARARGKVRREIDALRSYRRWLWMKEAHALDAMIVERQQPDDTGGAVVWIPGRAE
jgi:hypothetical protein